MKLSYAQRLEDYYLWRGFGGLTTGFYVDIGAGHPIEDNVSYWFYLQGWTGLVVEPQPELLAAYADLRPRDLRDGSLIGREDGEADFYVFPTLHGLSTTKRGSAEASRQYEADYRTEQREAVTLATLLSRHRVEQIDFLKVDVEGAELDVFEGADWRRWRPRVVVGEILSPGAPDGSWRAWDRILLAQNYECVLADDLNRYYVANEEGELKQRFPREEAPWDIVDHYWIEEEKVQR
ncbi:MAG: FkbM family methyltransferase [Beijerinckiaceae bacterium]